MPTIKVSSLLCIVRHTFIRDVISAIDGWHQCFEGIIEASERLAADPGRSRKDVIAFLKLLREMEGFGDLLMVSLPDDAGLTDHRAVLDNYRSKTRVWINKAERWKRTARNKRPSAHLN